MLKKILSFIKIISIVGFVFLLFLATGKRTDSGSSSSSSSSSTVATPKTSEEIRKEKIEILFSAWDGSHRGLTDVIKKSMNDPSSYKHDETVYWDKGDYLLVKMSFRGKNAFGGVVMNWVKAKVDLNGNVIEIIEQGP